MVKIPENLAGLATLQNLVRVAFMVGAVLLITGINQYCASNELQSMLQRNLNLQAQNDQLKIINASADSAIKVYARRSFIGDSLHELELEEERNIRRALGRDLLVANRTILTLRERLEGSITPAFEGEDTILAFIENNGLFSVDSKTTIKNFKLPGDVEVTYDVDVHVPELPLHVSITADPETCGIFVHVTTQHPGVEVLDTTTSVAKEVNSCLEKKAARWPWITTSVLEAIAIIGLIFF